MLRMEAQALRGRQVESSRRQVELEAELQLLREELARQVTVGQVTLQVKHCLLQFFTLENWTFLTLAHLSKLLPRLKSVMQAA